MHRRMVLAGGLAAALGGWLAAHADTIAGEAGLELLEPLYAISATPSGLTVRVASAGCATKADFAFYVRRAGVQTTLAFGRRQAERCKPRAASGGHIDMAFSYAELGVSADTPLTLLNPLISEPSALPSASRIRRRRRGR